MYGAMTKSGWRAGERAIAATALLMLIAAATCALLPGLPGWQVMWLLAIAIYGSSKWLTFATCATARNASTVRILGYLLLWPGMNANEFFDANAQVARPKVGEWLLAIVKLAWGLILVYGVAHRLIDRSAVFAGWIGLCGLVFVLHFGLFHLLSLVWRTGGMNARPIMNAPILASSPSDFWGRRWNMGFRDLAFGQLFRPFVGKIGVVSATLAVFVISGLVHELVISVPVRAGWGGPTGYFVLQGVGLLWERSPVGRRVGLGRGIIGRLMCGLLVLGPIGLLFHEQFILRSILPTLSAIGAI